MEPDPIGLGDIPLQEFPPTKNAPSTHIPSSPSERIHAGPPTDTPATRDRTSSTFSSTQTLPNPPATPTQPVASSTLPKRVKPTKPLPQLPAGSAAPAPDQAEEHAAAPAGPDLAALQTAKEKMEKTMHKADSTVRRIFSSRRIFSRESTQQREALDTAKSVRDELNALSSQPGIPSFEDYLTDKAQLLGSGVYSPADILQCAKAFKLEHVDIPLKRDEITNAKNPKLRAKAENDLRKLDAEKTKLETSIASKKDFDETKGSAVTLTGNLDEFLETPPPGGSTLPQHMQRVERKVADCDRKISEADSKLGALGSSADINGDLDAVKDDVDRLTTDIGDLGTSLTTLATRRVACAAKHLELGHLLEQAKTQRDNAPPELKKEWNKIVAETQKAFDDATEALLAIGRNIDQATTAKDDLTTKLGELKTQFAEKTKEVFDENLYIFGLNMAPATSGAQNLAAPDPATLAAIPNARRILVDAQALHAEGKTLEARAKLKELNALQGDLDKGAPSTAAFEAQLRPINTWIANCESRVAGMQKRLDDLRAAIPIPPGLDELQIQLDTANRELAALKLARDAKKTPFEQMQAGLAAITAEKDALLPAIKGPGYQTLKASNKTLETLNTRVAEHLKNRQEIATKQRETDAEIKNIYDKLTEISKMQPLEARRKLTSERKGLEQQLAKLEQVQGELEGKLGQLTGAVTQLNEQITTLENTITALPESADKISLNGKLGALKAVLDKLNLPQLVAVSAANKNNINALKTNLNAISTQNDADVKTVPAKDVFSFSMAQFAGLDTTTKDFDINVKMRLPAATNATGALSERLDTYKALARDPAKKADTEAMKPTLEAQQGALNGVLQNLERDVQTFQQEISLLETDLRNAGNALGSLPIDAAKVTQYEANETALAAAKKTLQEKQAQIAGLRQELTKAAAVIASPLSSPPTPPTPPPDEAKQQENLRTLNESLNGTIKDKITSLTNAKEEFEKTISHQIGPSAYQIAIKNRDDAKKRYEDLGSLDPRRAAYKKVYESLAVTANVQLGQLNESIARMKTSLDAVNREYVALNRDYEKAMLLIPNIPVADKAAKERELQDAKAKLDEFKVHLDDRTARFNRVKKIRDDQLEIERQP